MANISFDKIINANWDTQYLTSDGEIASRGYCARAIRYLRGVSFITPVINKYFPKADVYAGCAKIQQTIKECIEGGIVADNEQLIAVAEKINGLLDHIAEKRVDEAKMLAAARIQLPEAKRQPVQQPSITVNPDLVENIDSSEDNDLDPFADLDDELDLSTKTPAAAVPVDVEVIVVESPEEQEVEIVLPKESQATRGDARFGKGELDAHQKLEAAKQHATVVTVAAETQIQEQVQELVQEQVQAQIQPQELVTPTKEKEAEPVMPPTPRKPTNHTTLKRRELQLEEDDEVQPKRKRDEKKEQAKEQEKTQAKKPVVDPAPKAPAAKTGRNARRK